MKIENIEKNQSIEILPKYEVDGYITYELSGKSGFFSGKGTVCVSRQKIEEFKREVRDIKVGNEIFIYDTDSDCYIKTTLLDELGHYKIFYQIGGSHQDNYCKLSLETDYNGIQELLKL